MRMLLELACRDLRGAGRTLWVFCACLALGVALIAASGGVYRQVGDALLDDTRALFGGDVEVRSRAPLGDDVRAWMDANGTVSRMVEFRTMLMGQTGNAQLVELQAIDNAYPLVGRVELEPAGQLTEALAPRDGVHGIAIDPAVASRLGLAVGDSIEVGFTEMQVRAITLRQPDRSLRADWRGPPVLILDAALPETGLLAPGARPEYHYRVVTDRPPDAWRESFVAAHPDSEAELRTFIERNARLGEVLGQLGSGVLLIGFSALFIGGLEVFNSVQAWLQGKLGTLATLRAVGLRDGRLAAMVLLQVGMLAGAASLAGVIVGGALALIGAGVIGERLPLAASAAALPGPLALAWCFGVLTALTFALPALGRALSVSPAALFRGLAGTRTDVPARWRALTAASGIALTALVVIAMPDARFGAGFVLALLLMLALLEALVRALRTLARRLADHPALAGRFAARLALSGLYRRDSPLRPTLLSLGSAMSLLVASTLVVLALLETIDETVPDNAPALVFYDVAPTQRGDFETLVREAPSLERLALAPLVLGRLARVGDEALADSTDAHRRMEARDEHKMSHLQDNFDDVVLREGAWWPQDYDGPPVVAMEDREAEQLGLTVGDRLTFDIGGRDVAAELVAIYGQRRFQSRLWLEAIFPDGVLDPFVTRYVGMAWMNADDALVAQNRIAMEQPNVVTVRTAALLTEARALLGSAAAGLAAIGAVTLAASLLVLVSVITANRLRQVYLATLLHTLGARLSVIRASLHLEYLLLALLTSIFASVAGGVLATVLLHLRIGLEGEFTWWPGALVAVVVATGSLALGAHWLMRQLRMSPASLLRTS